MRYPVCGNKTRLKIRLDTIPENFSFYIFLLFL
ncbi:MULTISPECIES: cysteine-rich KTR domain-containing protein [unclassified Clostridioides]|nr:hypothetical protein [Clostridioides sp. ES-S-0001-02]MCC0640235.1 hypothetical protein [Clostridioides sp. ES-S-0049-03]MCC0651985.1 hypothetical protein [Clostridioides sp. ES-S-0001-03]MCC0657789.1 hypothetical protein [Clostridioides sp. ES-S-0123-01]MCC0673358.1 hypothetical protein [Clostridioides sp. ES-S-0145-01]MCC0674542.1 hypothetical protein [Clostridioides sp. ES-W-0018-02]MCC0694365.1 hypothetical protein [Clostridioides sp. ES-S-0048-02]MCC0703552.1 hypothetical protein [Cl